MRTIVVAISEGDGRSLRGGALGGGSSAPGTPEAAAQTRKVTPEKGASRAGTLGLPQGDEEVWFCQHQEFSQMTASRCDSGGGRVPRRRSRQRRQRSRHHHQHDGGRAPVSR